VSIYLTQIEVVDKPSNSRRPCDQLPARNRAPTGVCPPFTSWRRAGDWTGTLPLSLARSLQLLLRYSYFSKWTQRRRSSTASWYGTGSTGRWLTIGSPEITTCDTSERSSDAILGTISLGCCRNWQSCIRKRGRPRKRTYPYSLRQRQPLARKSRRRS
jgi:hypothetical protein